MLILVAVHGPDKGRVLMLPENRRHLIGRHCLSLTDSRISRRHARLERYNGAWTVEDLGSTNGTSVNRERIGEPRPLKAGDRIRVGKSEFMFTITPDATPPTPPGTAPTPSTAAHDSSEVTTVHPGHRVDAETTLDTIAVAAETASAATFAASVTDWAGLLRDHRPARPSLAPLAFACITLTALFLAAGILMDIADRQSAQASQAQASRPAATVPAAAAVAPSAEPKDDLTESVLSAVKAQTADDGKASSNQ